MQEVTSATAQPSGAASALSQLTSQSGELGQEQFLNLLVAQLQNQDPLNPTDNQEFIAELATFSSLETSKAMDAKLDRMLRLEEAQLTLSSLSQGAGLIGKEVEYLDPATGEQVRGTARSVYFDASGVLVEVDGTIVPINNIVIVSEDLSSGSGAPTDPTDPGDPSDPASDPAPPPTGGTGGSTGGGAGASSRRTPGTAPRIGAATTEDPPPFATPASS